MVNWVEIIIKFVIFFKISNFICCFLHLLNQLLIILQSQLIIFIFPTFVVAFIILIIIILTYRTHGPVLLFTKTMNIRHITFANSCSILAHIPILFLPNVPFVGSNSDKVNMFAWVRNIASNCHRIQQTILDIYILQRYVAKGDTRLSCARPPPVKWVKHAPRTISIRLLHLLRSNVDSPPYRPLHVEVEVVHILYKPNALIPWVRLHVDAFEGFSHIDIPESDVANTVTPTIWRHAADGHPHTQDHRCILDQHIFSAVTTHVALMTGFWHHNIIVVLDGDVVDMHASTTGIDSISVQGKQRQDALY